MPAQTLVRSRDFRDRSHNRYWWYRLADTDYVPLVFAQLTEDEWSTMTAWFVDTEVRFPSPGEVSIPGVTMLSSVIGGNGISRVVQAGHYVGYSTLLLGFLLRSMGKRNALFSVDIDPVATAYTQDWVDRAGLTEVVRLTVGDSAGPGLVDEASAYLGGKPQLVFIDSSHRYAHTLAELDLWYEALAPGGLIMLHDTSVFAQSFDGSNEGGVLRAAVEWAKQRGLAMLALNSFVDGSQRVDDLIYRDGCGLGLLQKPMAAGGVG
jgi:predicted O-methyltransferase YrrM